MTLDLFRLLVDFGLVVLIWMVQLVVYPSLRYYETPNLIKWHKVYTIRVTYIVLPLMLSELVIGGCQLWIQQGWYQILSVILILLLWLLTFIVFVPLHHKIDPESDTDIVTKALVQSNWIRTFLWTVLGVSSIIYFLNL